MEYQTGIFKAGEDYLRRLLSTFDYGQAGTPTVNRPEILSAGKQANSNH